MARESGTASRSTDRLRRLSTSNPISRTTTSVSEQVSTAVDAAEQVGAAGGEQPARMHAVVVEAVRAGDAGEGEAPHGGEALLAGDAEEAETAVHRHFYDARGRPAPHRARPSFV